MSGLLALLTTKPGVRTTEFWKSAIATVVSTLVAIRVIPDGLSQRYSQWVQLAAMLAAGLCVAGYALSRAIAKLRHGESIEQLLLELLHQENPANAMMQAASALSSLNDAAPPPAKPLVRDLERVLAEARSHVAALSGVVRSTDELPLPPVQHVTQPPEVVTGQ